MPAGTIAGFKAVVSERVIAVLETLFMGIPDEAGHTTTAGGAPFTVPVTNTFPSTRAEFPSIQVQMERGRIANSLGGLLLYIDRSGNPVYGFMAPGSKIVLSVRALSDAQRTWLVDVLDAGIVASTYYDAAHGYTYDGAIRTLFQNYGIVWRGSPTPTYPPPVPTDPRPEDQRYDAQLTIECDLHIQWTGTPYTPTEQGLTVQSTDAKGVVQSTDTLTVH